MEEQSGWHICWPFLFRRIKRNATIIDGIFKLVVALIGLAGVVLAALIAQKYTDKRHKEDIELSYKKEIDAMNERHKQDLQSIRNDYNKNFDDLKDSIGELRAVMQQTQAITELKIENLTEEVKRHNNFAIRMPVVEEQIKVANHRIDDLEKASK